MGRFLPRSVETGSSFATLEAKVRISEIADTAGEKTTENIKQNKRRSINVLSFIRQRCYLHTKDAFASFSSVDFFLNQGYVV